MGETGTDTPLAAAHRMLDIFASVGTDRFHVTWTDSAGHPRRPRSLRTSLQSLGGPLPHTENEDWLDAVYIAGIGLADLARTLPALLDTATADRLNLMIRPRGTGVRFIQLDDLAAEKLLALAAAMFLIIETSQAIIRPGWRCPARTTGNLPAACGAALAPISLRAARRRSPVT
jgi:hypothetical protein